MSCPIVVDASVVDASGVYVQDCRGVIKALQSQAL